MYQKFEKEEIEALEKGLLGLLLLLEEIEKEIVERMINIYHSRQSGP